MCNGSGGDVVAVVAAAPAEEEWSPIRETAPPQPHYQFDHFPVEDPGASSDMDTEEDVFPLVRRPRKASATTVPAVAGAGAEDEDARADAMDSNAGLSGAVSSSAVVALDRSEGGVFVTATAGNVLTGLLTGSRV